MNQYDLIVLYPTSNNIRGSEEQEKHVEVLANYLEIKENCYIFSTKGDVISVYPIQYTIIKSVLKLS